MDSKTRVDTSSSVDTVTRGAYRRGGSSDLRSPCPMINCLANHGYLPRDGRNVHRADFYSAMKLLGCSTLLAGVFSMPIFLEDKKGNNSQSPPQQSFLSKLWYYIRNPLAIVLSKVGMRPHGQVDSTGKPYLTLDQLALHDAVEHDVSLSRRDKGQGDNCSPQQDLIANILAASSDGGQYLSLDDFVKLRKQRIETQKLENKTLNYGSLQHELGCGEIALILKVLGDGTKVKREILEAFFVEERLPLEEGWQLGKKSLGLVEIKMMTNRVKSMIPFNI